MNKRSRAWGIYRIGPWAIALVAAIGIAYYWNWLENSGQEGGYPIYQVAVLWVLVLLFCLSLGNYLLFLLIRFFLPSEKVYPQRFALQLISSLIFSMGIANLTYVWFKNTYTELPPDQDQLILLNIYGLFFLIPVLSIQFGIHYLRKWKKAVVQQEKLQKEQVHSELVALKSHLSPHFLFNNLNMLSALIKVENQPAQEYLDRLAEVYRYVLQNRELELVALQQELKFLESYRYLLQQRFTNSLEVTVEVPESCHDWQIPPLSLQMVLENALKHNKLSERAPLQIRIYTDNDYFLLVQNKLQLRTIPETERSGFGLENIRRRYWLIARETIKVEESLSTFTVGLPLLKIR